MAARADWSPALPARVFVPRMLKGVRPPEGGWTAESFARDGVRLVKGIHRAAQITQRKAFAPVVRIVTRSFERLAGRVVERVTRKSAKAGLLELLVPSHADLWQQALDEVFTEERLVLAAELTPAVQSVTAQGYSKVQTMMGQDPDPSWNPRILETTRQIASRITGINETTRNHFRDLIGRAVSDGLSIPETAARLQREFPEMEKARIRTIARTELSNAWTWGSAASYMSTPGLLTVSVIGCIAREPKSPQYRGESTCNIQEVPVGEIPALLAVGWHPNHTGTLVPSKFANEDGGSDTKPVVSPVVPPVPKDLKVAADGYRRKALEEAGVREVEEWIRQTDDRLAVSFSAAKLCARTPIETAPSVLKDGRFKSQFETGTSKGTLSPTLRADVEKEMFGYAKDLMPEQRPVYGYLSVEPDKELGALVNSYGDVAWVFKDGVKARATWTGADSLVQVSADNLIPSPVNRPSQSSLTVFGRGGVQNAEALAKEGPKNSYTWEVSRPQYYEAQIHGGLSVSEVDHVLLFNKHNVPGLFDVTKKLLDEAGIRYIEILRDR